MCVAVYKPVGQKMPSKKIFSNCFSSNDDGAGFMFPVNGKVHYEKGFMSFSAFKKGLKAAVKKYGISTIDTPMVFHFRITSQGGVKPELTHPFPVCRSYDEMRKLSGDVDMACVHNGIIDFASSYKVVDYNDTMEFDKEVLCPLIKGHEKYYENKTLMGLINYLLCGNRFAIMDKNGHVELIGAWIEDKGIYYSNTSYKAKKYYNLTPVKTYCKEENHFGFGYGGYSYDDDDDLYWAGYISKEQEKEFLETGMLRCECGEEMLIEWSDELQRCVAYCFRCNLSYSLTDKAEDYAWEKGLVLGAFDDDDYLEAKAWNESFGIKGAY